MNQKLKVIMAMAMLVVVSNSAFADGEFNTGMGYAFGAIISITVMISVCLAIYGGYMIGYGGDAMKGKLALLGALLMLVLPALILGVVSKIFTGYVVPVANFGF